MTHRHTGGAAVRRDRSLGATRTGAAVFAAAAILALAGCSQPGASTATDQPGASTATDEVTLTYQIWDAPQEQATQQIIDAFEAENPTVSVELSVVPWAEYWTKLQTTATSGNAPDVFWMNTPTLSKYADGGVLLPLDDVVSSAGIDLADFAPATVASATYDGTLYGMPKDVDALALWYNGQLFEAGGVDLPTNDWTWDDMVAAAGQLTDPAAGVYGIPALPTDQLSYYNTIPQSGGFVISEDGTTSGYDDPRTIAGIQAWVDLIHTHHVSPTLQQMSDTDPTNMFQSGKVAMTYAGSWMIPVFTADEAFAQNVGVVRMPLLEQRGGVSNSVANVGFSGTEHTSEVEAFLVFLGSEAAADIIAEGGVLPARTAAQQIWADAYGDVVDTQVFIDTAADNTPFPRSINTPAWESVATAEFTRAWNGEISVEEAAQSVAAQMREALAAERG